MADRASSKPVHAVFAFLITVIAMVVQMHFPNSSPANKYSPNVWIFIVCLFLYGCSSAYYKSGASTSNTDAPYFNLSSHVAAISGSMACAVLISVLVSKPVLALIIILYLTRLLIYFSPNPVTRICKKIGSYMYEMCKESERNHGPRHNLEV